MIQRLCIIGVGLIGGSLALALKQADACQEVVGCGRSVDNLKRAVERGAIDHFDTDAAVAVRGADMVVLAVPLGSIASVLRRMRGHLSADTVITDVGSVKGSVVRAAQEVFSMPPTHFVPAHPIAGGEQTGVEAADPALFIDHRVILTPLDNTNPQAVEKVTEMWEATQAEVVRMDVQQHDAVLAATSHLPHMLAYVLVDTLARLPYEQDVFRFAAGGFRDFTRIASSDPVIWHDICMANREALVKALERFEGELEALKEAIRREDSSFITRVFTHAKQARDGVQG